MSGPYMYSPPPGGHAWLQGPSINFNTGGNITFVSIVSRKHGRTRRLAIASGIAALIMWMHR